MDKKEFQEREMDDFLKQEYPYDEVRLYIEQLEQSRHADVIAMAKLGLQSGLEQFLKAHDNAATIYESANISDFQWDITTESEIEKLLEELQLNPAQVHFFAADVCKNYRGFVYNESLERFKELF